MKHERLFFALWPDAPCRDALAAIVATLGLARARPVRSANLHLTLCFLGNVDATGKARAREVAGRVRVPAFELELCRLGYWKRSRILWSAPAGVPGALTRLEQDLRQGLAPILERRERERSFSAHLTLARKVATAMPVMPNLHIVWRIDAFHLVKSVTSAEGARYDVVESWPLRAGEC